MFVGLVFVFAPIFVFVFVLVVCLYAQKWHGGVKSAKRMWLRGRKLCPTPRPDLDPMSKLGAARATTTTDTVFGNAISPMN